MNSWGLSAEEELIQQIDSARLDLNELIKKIYDIQRCSIKQQEESKNHIEKLRSMVMSQASHLEAEDQEIIRLRLEIKRLKQKWIKLQSFISNRDEDQNDEPEQDGQDHPEDNGGISPQIIKSEQVECAPEEAD